MSYEDTYLKHYGVLGMKWGKRKAVGSTSTSPKKYKKVGTDPDGSPIYKEVKARRMSNKELQSRVKRLELEKKYRDLTPKPETGITVDKVVKSLGTVAAITGSAYTIYTNLDKLSKAAKAAKKVAT